MNTDLPSVDWYYDFISPYAYLSFASLDDFAGKAQINYRPVLFAGLLKHWENKGPAEISSKREWTYRQCVWRAHKRGIPFRPPAAHPFNPLPFLRLAIAAGNTREVIDLIFRELWTTGADVSDPKLIEKLMSELDVQTDSIEEVKMALRTGTEQAISKGVFGVPTMIVNEQRFWGDDAHEFVAAYLSDPDILNLPEMKRIENMPVGATRKELE